MYHKEPVNSGLNGLDKVIEFLRYGDNVVWQITSINEYKYFAEKFAKKLAETSNNATYINFSNKQPLFSKETMKKVNIFKPRTESFESFTIDIYRLIEYSKKETFYVFDCLSDLVDLWAADWMIANFFKLICPLLYLKETVAYFSIYRNFHSHTTVMELKSTTQIFIDVYQFNGVYYVHPIKVFERNSPQMFLPHKILNEDNFEPVINSFEASTIFSSNCYLSDVEYTKIPDAWERLFKTARKISLSKDKDLKENILTKIFNVMFSKDKKIVELLKKYLTINDVLLIKNRMIGTGFIGGKAVGMILARKILETDYPKFALYNELHDSFFIGSDVFYEYIIYNGWWDIFVSQKTEEGYFPFGEKLERLFLKGEFPPHILDKFIWMLSYYGQYPIVIRSSSLLEDGFGNAFAGKYESFFSCTSGSPKRRLEDFLILLKKVYSSVMTKEALAYRKERGLDKVEETMSVLVQRVSGSFHENLFFPDMAGVGLSYNTYVWHPDIDPNDGMLRVVCGLGTRAVNTNAEDYSKLISLTCPTLSIHSNIDEIRKYSQKDADVLEINKITKSHYPLFKLINSLSNEARYFLTSRDYKTENILNERGKKDKVYYISFEKLLAETDFASTMKKVLKTVEKAYGNPVDMEYTVNFFKNNTFRINIVQCRPLQSKSLGGHNLNTDFIKKLTPILKIEGNFMGGSIFYKLDKMIYLSEENYKLLNNNERYALSRYIGELNNNIPKNEKIALVLPGRIGTTTPSLGMPIAFSELNKMQVLVEMGFSDSELAPELSFGTHFFQDLVETGIFYMVVYPKKSLINFEQISKLKSTNAHQNKNFADILDIYDLKDQNIFVFSDIKSQVAGFFKQNGEE
jgi:hypothetical protein